MAKLSFRKFGVRGVNLPAKKTLSVVPSDFSIGGMVIQSERKYKRTYQVRNMEEFAEIFGSNITSTWYGYDAVKGFFDNVVGVDASLYVQSVVGYAGGAFDAVNAYRNVANAGGDASSMPIKAAYLDELEYGVSGNRTGTKVVLADRFTTAASGTCTATGQSYAALNSVIDIKVGDLICFHTGALGAVLVYKIITGIDENTKQVSWSGNFEITPGGGQSLGIGDSVTIPGFKIETYRKNLNGTWSEVDTDLGDVICSTESSVTDYYVGNVFKQSKWIQVSYTSAQTLGNRIPVADANVTYLASGADGTALTTTAHLAALLAFFDEDSIRFLSYPETTTQSLQEALVTYSLARDDTPIVIVNIAEDRTESQLITIGQGYQKSDFYPAVIVANWLGVDDPFANSLVAPNRHVPNVGHVMGAWIWTIGIYGIHFVPCTSATTIKGVNEVIGEQFKNSADRTDIADAGINVIQDITGQGMRIMNLHTLSTDLAYVFGNGILMRNYIKVSVADSLQGSENTPNSLNRIQNDKMAAVTFMYNLWYSGSTGNVPAGETFGQGLNINGSATTPEDHFEVQADLVNNPQSKINMGERNIWIYFTYPAPTESVEVGVGILLR